MGIDSETSGLEILSGMRSKAAPETPAPGRRQRHGRAHHTYAEIVAPPAVTGHRCRCRPDPGVPGSPTYTALLLEVVAEKTGYPVGHARSLHDRSMEADLGIDSIKRVEILSASARCASLAPELPEVDASEDGRAATPSDEIVAFTWTVDAPPAPPWATRHP